MDVSEEQHTDNSLVICRYCEMDSTNTSSITTKSSVLSDSDKADYNANLGPMMKRDHIVKHPTSRYDEKRYYNVGNFAIHNNPYGKVELLSMNYIMVKSHHATPRRFIYVGSIR